MIINRLLNRIFTSRKVRLKRRYCSSAKSRDDNIRNIAILAHIDAGLSAQLFTFCDQFISNDYDFDVFFFHNV